MPWPRRCPLYANQFQFGGVKVVRVPCRAACGQVQISLAGADSYVIKIALPNSFGRKRQLRIGIYWVTYFIALLDNTYAPCC